MPSWPARSDFRGPAVFLDLDGSCDTPPSSEEPAYWTAPPAQANHPMEPSEPQQPDERLERAQAEEKRPYIPPSVESVELSKEAAESLT